MSQIRVACVCPIVGDPTSFYRGLGPLMRLQKQNRNIQLFFPANVDWSSLAIADLLFLQRPATPEHFQALIVAKDLGLKVWCDMDDDNLSVPKDNPTYNTYNQLHIKDAIVKLARHCDVLTVTTEHLKRKYGIYNKNTVIIPNAIDDGLMHLRQIPPGPRQKKALWRGNPSHQRNLMSVGKEIVSLARKHEDWRFSFFGIDPIDITDVIRNNEVIGATPILDYYKAICALHSALFYYPLIATDHAQARSHICWLEATFAGSLTVASKNQEFTRPGVLNFSTPQEFESVMDQVMNGGVDIETRVQESWAEIQSKYVLSQTNKKRMEIIESLL